MASRNPHTATFRVTVVERLWRRRKRRNHRVYEVRASSRQHAITVLKAEFPLALLHAEFVDAEHRPTVKPPRAKLMYEWPIIEAGAREMARQIETNARKYGRLVI